MSDEWKFPRLTRFGARFRTWWAVAGVFVAVFGLVGLPSDVTDANLAVRLGHDGERATVSQVEVRVTKERFARTPMLEHSAVRVHFVTANGRAVTTLLKGIDKSGADGFPGWRPADKDSGYAPPLSVVYDPKHPSLAMAAKDRDSISEQPHEYYSDLGAVFVGGVLLFVAFRRTRSRPFAASA